MGVIAQCGRCSGRRPVRRGNRDGGRAVEVLPGRLRLPAAPERFWRQRRRCDDNQEGRGDSRFRRVGVTLRQRKNLFS